MIASCSQTCTKRPFNRDSIKQSGLKGFVVFTHWWNTVETALNGFRFSGLYEWVVARIGLTINIMY